MDIVSCDYNLISRNPKTYCVQKAEEHTVLDSLDLALNWPLGPFIKDNDILRSSKVYIDESCGEVSISRSVLSIIKIL